ncbi:MAG: NADH-quinone oxidoreductase subunit L [Fimbriimonadaceae bacterium]
MEAAKNLIWLVLFLPVVGSLIQALIGGRVLKQLGPKKGKGLMGLLAVTPIAIAFGIGAYLTMQLSQAEPSSRHAVATLFSWIDFSSISIPFEVIIDPLSMTMVLIITGIGSLIHLYATGYMAEEKEYPRFFTYLNLFIAAMLILVLGNNLALMFIGWEGVGVCSYLLIGFWYKDVVNAKAANKAFIVNRIGDWGLTLGMFLLASFFLANIGKMQVAAGETRWLSYDVLLPNAVTLLQSNPGIATAIALLFFVGACGKSAQFPLYFWLPDAMAGPTPVSALIHAATMVTSGVVMLNRLHVLFELSPVASAVIAMVGAFTALFAAAIAFGQTDIKKVLAYSTVSQLGFMFIGCGAGGYWTGMFHVTTHAFFKALLFLGSGAVIYAMAHNQDMRNYGNLRKYLPITFATMFIGFLAIAGVPGLAGFFSKEAILGYALGNHHAQAGGYNLGVVAGWTGLVVAAMTACYMTRMTWLTFFGPERWRAIPEAAHHDHHEEHVEHHAHADHGPDEHGFFMTEDELHAQPHEHEHHHDLDASHAPKEVPPSMYVPLVVLAALSLFGGYLLHNNEMLEKWLYPTGLPVLTELEKHPHGLPLMALSIGAASLGLAIGLFMYWKGLPASEGWDLTKWAPWRRAAANQFGYDDAMVSSAVEGGDQIATALWKRVDVGIVDRIVNGLGGLANGVGRGLSWFQTGQVRGYALMMLAGVALLLGYVAFKMKARETEPMEHVEMTQEVARR